MKLADDDDPLFLSLLVHIYILSQGTIRNGSSRSKASAGGVGCVWNKDINFCT